MANDDDIVIVSAFRTPIGSFNGVLSSYKAHELGVFVLQHILNVTNKTIPDEVIIGQSLTAAQGQNPARQTVLKSGLPDLVTATTVNMLCGSGLKSCVLGCQSIKSGDNKVVICGGQESMSQAPHCIHLRNGHKMNDATMIDSMIKDGLTDAFHSVHMGNTAEHVAKVYSVSRNDQDKYALASQQKYAEAFKNNFFKNEIGNIMLKNNS